MRTEQLTWAESKGRMVSGLIHRATRELHVDGRTLVGVAVPFDKVATVTDGPRSAPYLESFARTAFDKTLTQRPEPRPLYFAHEYLYGPADPIGVAHFERTAKDLRFVAYLSRTRSADERLELVKDGAARDASIGAKPIRVACNARPKGSSPFARRLICESSASRPPASPSIPTPRCSRSARNRRLRCGTRGRPA